MERKPLSEKHVPASIQYRYLAEAKELGISISDYIAKLKLENAALKEALAKKEQQYNEIKDSMNST